MNDDVKFSLRQIDGAWRLMCAGGPTPVVAASEGIQYIFSGVPISFFNLAVLTGSGLSAEAWARAGARLAHGPPLSLFHGCWWSPTSSSSPASTPQPHWTRAA